MKPLGLRSLINGTIIAVIAIVQLGCGGSPSTASTGPTLQQTAAPGITPATGTYNGTQTVTLTPGIAGATIYYSLTGTASTGSTQYSVPFTASSTTTVSAVDIGQSNSTTTYTVSNPASSTITINVPPTISMPANMTTPFGTNVVLSSSVVTASSSCSPVNVTGKWVLDDSNTTALAPAVLSSYSSDSTNATWGTVITGNTASTAKSIAGGTITLTCGTATASMHVGITAKTPTVASASPNVCAPTSCAMLLTGTNITAYNETAPGGWGGTEITSNLGACPTTQPTTLSSGNWVSFTQINWGYTSSGSSLGSWNVSGVNLPTSIGTDGGWTCTLNIYTVTASGHALDAGGNTSFNINPETGDGNIVTKGVVTGTFKLGAGANTPVITPDSMYAMQPSLNAVAVIDPQSNAVHSASLGDHSPVGLVADNRGNVYALASEGTNSAANEVFLISPTGNVTKVADANGYTGIAAIGEDIVGVEPSEDGTTTVHTLSMSGAAESTFTIQGKATSVVSMPNGVVLAFQAGTAEVSVLDLDAYKASQALMLSANILNVSGNRIALLSGDIVGMASHTDGTGAETAALTLYSHQAVEDLYAGFAVSTANGTDTLILSHRTQGVLQTQQVPLMGAATTNPKFDEALSVLCSSEQKLF